MWGAPKRALQERIKALELERLRLRDRDEEVSLEFLQRLAVLREEAGQQPHFGGTMPHRWEWWNLHQEGRLRICVYCAIVREIDDDLVLLPLDT